MPPSLNTGPRWADLSALAIHYETQPLPHLFSWYAHHLPPWAHRWSAAATLAIELVLPFGIFLGVAGRFAACAGTVGLMVLIMATGNYGFFNGLTAALSLTLLDDSFYTGVAWVYIGSSGSEGVLLQQRWTASLSAAAAGGGLGLHLIGAIALMVRSLLAAYSSTPRSTPASPCLHPSTPLTALSFLSSLSLPC